MDEKRSADDAFFESCALRMQKIPPKLRAYLQLQISQLFLNAENYSDPQLPQLPITPLPITHQQPVGQYRQHNLAPVPQHSYQSTSQTPQQGMMLTGDIISDAMNLSNMQC